jgi:hypothetical protein
LKNGEVEMEVFILADSNIEDNGDRKPINKKITLELVHNKEILFEIMGDSIKDVDLKSFGINVVTRTSGHTS